MLSVSSLWYSAFTQSRRSWQRLYRKKSYCRTLHPKICNFELYIYILTWTSQQQAWTHIYWHVQGRCTSGSLFCPIKRQLSNLPQQRTRFSITDGTSPTASSAGETHFVAAVLCIIERLKSDRLHSVAHRSEIAGWELWKFWERSSTPLESEVLE